MFEHLRLWLAAELRMDPAAITPETRLRELIDSGIDASHPDALVNDRHRRCLERDAFRLVFLKPRLCCGVLAREDF